MISVRFNVLILQERDKIKIDGKIFDNHRNDIEDYALEKICREEITFDNFVEQYSALLKENDVPLETKLYYIDTNLGARRNKYSNSRKCLSMLSSHFLPNNSFQKSVSDTAYPQSQAVRFCPDFLRLTPFSPFYLYFMAVFVIISIKKYLMRLAKGEGTLWHTKSSQALLNPRTALITVHITSMFRFFL